MPGDAETRNGYQDEDGCPDLSLRAAASSRRSDPYRRTRRVRARQRGAQTHFVRAARCDRRRVQDAVPAVSDRRAGRPRGRQRALAHEAVAGAGVGGAAGAARARRRTRIACSRGPPARPRPGCTAAERDPADRASGRSSSSGCGRARPPSPARRTRRATEAERRRGRKTARPRRPPPRSRSRASSSRRAARCSRPRRSRTSTWSPAS